MKTNTEQLSSLIKKNIAPIYLISGDEFLLAQEARDTIYKHLIPIGYEEKEIFHVDNSFNWENFLGSVNNRSLFGDQSIIELRIQGKISDGGKKILQTYLKNPASEKVVLMIMNKLDASQQKSAWFKTIDNSGVIIQIWPIEPNQLPTWINKRLELANLKTDRAGLQLLADHVAGNLLAAIQEIEKLKLLYQDGNLTAEQISDAISDNSRFNVFGLLDAAMSGNVTTTSKILDNLKNENVEPTIILWAITKELRPLINISAAVNNGLNMESALTKNGVWQKRKPLVKNTLSRHSLNKLNQLLKYALNIDLIIKGADRQRSVWHELKKLYLNLAKVIKI